MDGRGFDALARSFAMPGSRRRLLQRLGAAALGGLGLARAAGADAADCKAAGKACSKNGQCCSGACAPAPGKTSVAGSGSICCAPGQVQFPRGACCTRNPTATTCAGRCGTVADNCGLAVECPGCPACQACGADHACHPVASDPACLGCCDAGGTCQAGSSTSACGTGGAACAACSGTGVACSGGTCCQSGLGPGATCAAVPCCFTFRHCQGGTCCQLDGFSCGVDGDALCCSGVCSDATHTCCTPDCAGKACGAADGCGGTCQAGACPSGQACSGGACQCQNDDIVACNVSCVGGTTFSTTEGCMLCAAPGGFPSCSASSNTGPCATSADCGPGRFCRPIPPDSCPSAPGASGLCGTHCTP